MTKWLPKFFHEEGIVVLCDWAYCKRQLLCQHTLFLSVSAVLSQPLSSDKNRLTTTILI